MLVEWWVALVPVCVKDGERSQRSHGGAVESGEAALEPE